MPEDVTFYCYTDLKWGKKKKKKERRQPWYLSKTHFLPRNIQSLLEGGLLALLRNMKKTQIKTQDNCHSSPPALYPCAASTPVCLHPFTCLPNKLMAVPWSGNEQAAWPLAPTGRVLIHCTQQVPFQNFLLSEQCNIQLP